MKHPDYDWMLFGCHPISDIAMAYCPCEHATSSTRAFRRLLRLYPKLYAEPLQERLHGTFHHPDPSAYSCRDSRIGNAVRSVSSKSRNALPEKTPDIF